MNRFQILSPSLVLSTYVPLSLPSLIYLRPYIPTYLPSFVFHLSIYTSFLIFLRRIFSTTFFYCVSRSYSFALLLIYISVSLFLSTSSPSQCLYISLYLTSLSLSLTHSLYFSLFSRTALSLSIYISLSFFLPLPCYELKIFNVNLLPIVNKKNYYSNHLKKNRSLSLNFSLSLSIS